MISGTRRLNGTSRAEVSHLQSLFGPSVAGVSNILSGYIAMNHPRRVCGCEARAASAMSVNAVDSSSYLPCEHDRPRLGRGRSSAR